MKKVLAISSVMLGVVFLAGCGQQPVSQTQPTTPAPVAQAPAQPTPIDETANWQTYTNAMFGYSIKVPKEYTVTDNGGPTGAGRNSSASIIGNYNEEQVIINLHSEDGYVADGGCSKGDGNIKLLTTTDGQKIDICKDMYHPVEGALYAVIGKKNTVIDITGDKDKITQTQVLFEQILATFKFTK